MVDESKDKKQWEELVDDLWNMHFPQLTSLLPEVGRYAFIKGACDYISEGETDKQGILACVVKCFASVCLLAIVLRAAC